MRVQTLSRRLGAAALVLSVGVGVSACGGDSGSEDSSSSASDGSSDSGTDEATEDAAEEEAPEEASLTELSAEDFYPTVMAAMEEAGSFTFTTTSDSAGQAQEMAGEARFGDDGVEMKATGTGAQAMDMILIDKTMYMKSAALGTG